MCAVHYFWFTECRGFFSRGRTPQWTKKVLKKILLNSSIYNSSAWREDGKRGCLLQGQPELSPWRGRRLSKKSFCFYLFTCICSQIAAGLFAGHWFSVWVYQFQGTSVCCVEGFVVFLLNSQTCKSFVNTISRHCQRAFGSSKDFLWRGDTASIKVAVQVPQ